MITNTDLLFSRMKEYQDKRKAVMDEYEKRLEWLEDKRGSEYFTEEEKIARDKRDEALQTLRGEYDESARTAIKAMKEANDKRPAAAPTEEELRIIQMLKLRDTVSEEELSMIANSVKNNALALDVVAEVARKNGILRDYRSICTENRLSPSYVSDKLEFLSDNVFDFLAHDTARAARLGAAYREQHYGIQGDERNLAKRPLFETKEDFFKQTAWLEGDTLSRFMEAVDG